MQQPPAQGPQTNPKPGKLLSLQRIVQEVSTAPNLTEATRILTERISEAMHTDVCSIYLFDHSAQSLLLAASKGLNPTAVGKVYLGLDEGLVGLTATSSELLNVRDASKHPRFKLVPGCGEERYRGFLGVPIIHRGETLGVVVVQQATARRYRDTDVAFLITLATQLAGVITLSRASSSIDLLTHDQAKHDYTVEAIAGAPGVAIGVGAVVIISTDLDSIPDRVPEDILKEEAAFRAAVKDVVDELHRIQNGLAGVLLPEDSALFEALAMIASSDMLVDATVARIHAGNWALGALRETIAELANQFTQIEDPYLRERARDIQDLGRRILVHLRTAAVELRDYPKKTILVGEDLSPIDLARVPVDRLAGVISGHGSSLSHLAILARAMGIPAIVGTASLVPANELEGKELIIDGYRGMLYINPSKAATQGVFAPVA